MKKLKIPMKVQIRTTAQPREEGTKKFVGKVGYLRNYDPLQKDGLTCEILVPEIGVVWAAEGAIIPVNDVKADDFLERVRSWKALKVKSSKSWKNFFSKGNENGETGEETA